MQRLLLGAGGHARVLIDALQAADETVAGVLDPRHAPGSRFDGLPVLGGDEWLEQQPSSSISLVNGVGANPTTASRRALFERWCARGYRFDTVIHPSAVIAISARLSEGVQVLARAVIQTGAVLAGNVVVNTGAIIEHDVAVAAHAFIGPGVVICGDVRIGAAAFVGAGAVVLPGVTVGPDSIVAAGATVIRDVPAGQCVIGSSARERLPSSAAPGVDGQGEDSVGLA
ncbi:Acetyltransferase (isoleucine patch superfamily) protein [Nitrococcus mobilis Nb-231]|uniref:Acetyltransferase (Isoleucine patch superfamily) protein n=1 Tax=Nitrococcus mobilis Nb-231 TaxID=314278 RepID=A4BMG4_9GAMM|nr:Acetyltransferase (isoleucine patch superfamily) protein [Nitrococcus mobilis Nb-231]